MESAMETRHAVLVKASIPALGRDLVSGLLRSELFGAVIEFARKLLTHPLSKQDTFPTIQIAAIMCAVVALMSGFTLWMARKRDAKAATRPL